MLQRDKVIQALEAKRAQFQSYQADRKRQEATLEEWLDRFFQYDFAAMAGRLAESNVDWPGARPTAEWDRAQQLCLPFAQPWANHSEARAWALEALRNRPVAAVDGSQINPSKDFSIPVGAVQIGWFINHHRVGGSYVKDVEFAVLGPTDLLEDAADAADTPDNSFPNQNVNQLRFVLECERLCALMAQHADLPPQDKPLCFFDGSFIISFAGKIRPLDARPYVQAVQKLLDSSQRDQIPLVGFVDSSASRDLVGLISRVVDLPGRLDLSDGALLHLGNLLPTWGDRTPFFFCAREDGLSRSGRGDFYTDVAFTYIRLAAERPPARLEIPRWLLEAGLADTVVDIVRGECVVGTGYPYVIETADALAVITMEDRQRFYAFFQQFAEQAGLPFTQARKALSKLGRR